MSDCGRYGVTVIAFIGSVFSPYYHFSGRRDPEDHVCINVALYSNNSNRWAMTERGKSALKRDESLFQVGASNFEWKNGKLIIRFEELSVPRPPWQFLPTKISGEILLTPNFLNSRQFSLDPGARHVWQPIAPSAQIEVQCSHFPEGEWHGNGYFDSNWGSEPLESGFQNWDWSRGLTDEGEAVILYDAICADGSNKQLALNFGASGDLRFFDPPKRQKLTRGFWGVARHVQCAVEKTPNIIRDFEDSPFYTRSLVRNFVNGKTVNMMHESLSGKRFANPLVKLMLPVRMPRRKRWPT